MISSRLSSAARLSLFRIGTGSHPPGQLVADLDFLSGLGQVQRLMIRIH